MASYYEHYYEAFGSECLRAGFMINAMRARATAIAAYASQIAPVDTGEYAASFEVSDGITSYGGRGTRAYARVTNTAGHAAAVEYGFGRVPRYRTLGKSLHIVPGDVKARY